jgi:hypothetical protein
MNDFVLVWVLMFFNPSQLTLTYSPPVKTLEDCQRMATMVLDYWNDRNVVAKGTKCIQVNILRKASEK